MRVIELVSVSSAKCPRHQCGWDAFADHAAARGHLGGPDRAGDQGRRPPNATVARRQKPQELATVADAAAVMNWPITNTRLRSTASAITPAKAPRNSIGNVRAAVTTATARPDPVMSKVNSAAASTSNQRIALTQPPIDQRRMKLGEDSNPRRPPLPAATIGRFPSYGRPYGPTAPHRRYHASKGKSSAEGTPGNERYGYDQTAVRSHR